MSQLSQVVLERIEDNTDNDDNKCMTEGMREKKVVKVVLRRIEDNSCDSVVFF